MRLLTAKARGELATLVALSLDVLATFEAKGFAVHGVNVRRTEGGFKWRCGRCRWSGAFYGGGAAAPLARFVEEHAAGCPC